MKVVWVALRDGTTIKIGPRQDDEADKIFNELKSALMGEVHFFESEHVNCVIRVEDISAIGIKTLNRR